MKLGSVTKPDKRNKITSKQIDNDVVSTNSDVIVIFLIYSQFGAIRLPDSGRIVCKTYIFMKSNLFLTKLKKELKSIERSSHTIALSKGTIFAKKRWHQ